MPERQWKAVAIDQDTEEKCPFPTMKNLRPLATLLTVTALAGTAVGQDCPQEALREAVEKARREAIERQQKMEENPPATEPAPAEPASPPPAPADATPKPATPAPTGNPDDVFRPLEESRKSAAVKRQKARVTGLLVQELSSSNYAASASGLSAVVIPEETHPEKALLRFNQTVGPMMVKSLAEVKKLMAVRHGIWPTTQVVDIGFDEKYTPKDGPSAAVACGLLLDSMLADYDLDPSFAVTGDVNADGLVQPVGGVADKLRAAVQRKCTVVAIPAACEQQVIDSLVVSGPALAARTQILGMQTFDDAVSYGKTRRDSKVTVAMTRFQALQTQLLAGSTGISARINSPQVHDELQAILAELPQHLSAKLLLMVAERRLPTRLSTRGSLDLIDERAGFIIQAVKTPTSADSLAADLLANALSRLRQVRPTFDPRILPYADALANFGQIVRDVRTRPPIRTPSEAEKVRARIVRAAEQVDTEMQRLLTDRVLIEDANK